VRFLADENFPRAAVAALQAAGHDVVWVTIAAPGAEDTEVLARATREQRILLTFDKDFGELAGRSGPVRACGVVLVSTPAPRSAEAARLLAERIAARNDWAGHFSVIEPARVRMRSLRS
jgi:predicted nuclease of predicted toxin-antitoxin system